MTNQKKQKSHLPLRLNILFFIIFILFSLLILQLGVVQILNGEEAQQEVNRTDKVVSETPVPRGKIFDRNGEIVVDNEQKYAITYTPRRNVQPEDNLRIAEQLSQYMDMETGEVTERDQKDYWLLKNWDKGFAKLDEEEKQLSDSDQYQLVLERITEDELSTLTEDDMKVAAIKRELDRATQLTPHVIKSEGITKEEYAVIAENSHEMPGINVSTDWDRMVPYQEFTSLIGTVRNRNRGLPRDKVNFYQNLNYKLNDRVGDRGIEEEYELYLQGNKEIREHITDKSGNVIKSEVIRQGERGKDIVLSIDMEMQQALDEIVQEEMLKVINENPNKNEHFDKTLAVMMDPNTGEVLAMSGQKYYEGDEDTEPYFNNEAYRVLMDTHLPGSTVKGATVIAGLDSGVIEPGETFRDQPLRFRGSQDKVSWTPGIGVVDDIDAIKRSSNIYMYRTAMRLGGHWDYTPNESLRYNGEGFDLLSSYYRQFGLGSYTGVDYPREENGFLGSDVKANDVLEMAIGQHENYTAMQLVQYVSTIANGGYRMEPHIVKQINNPTNDGSNSVYEANEPNVLNKVNVPDEYIERVQEGFRQVFQEPGGTASYRFSDAEYSPAGKTGTAESAIYPGDNIRIDTLNLLLVGYAPHDDPEVAFAIVAPHLDESDSHINNEIGRRMLDKYFEIKEERQSSEESSTEDEENEESEEESGE
ncbi:peptidoglycan D,D-transpeptidase FtsI family protein [Aquisalibacillus elongatus]|uniref:serine-type D-Ala-D-Ala carboxypeptidase n=1 Tax=Aquisalibacillus elongatus TaxID=485577 RepID=A0A3N5C804_9BACI|nr:penicillin-binding protein 2 [Aquisalibacillus elongatus]RPF55622.1 cell elongation-specific peptidoglycan D,D-transpeptidase [Aquisalibacillus elongatus]